MKDEYILRMIAETCKTLSDMHWSTECRHLHGPYNALLQAAKANHPNDPFLSALPQLVRQMNDEGREEAINSSEMNILFTQLRIALEAHQGEPNRALVPQVQSVS